MAKDRDMRGLLADVNIQGHLRYLRRLVEGLDEWPLVAEFNLEFATFPDLNLDPRLDDRTIWHFCQQNGWLLLTDNRNDSGPDSLEAVLADSWHTECLPILTLANKDRFEHSLEYAMRVAYDIVYLLHDAALNMNRDQPRIYVPRSATI